MECVSYRRMRNPVAWMMMAVLAIGSTLLASTQARADVGQACSAQFKLNGVEVCTDANLPSGYPVPVYDDQGRYVGDRWMYSLRAVGEGLGAMVDYEQWTDSDGAIKRVVWLQNRHNLVRMDVGSGSYDKWIEDAGTGDVRHHTGYLDVPPQFKGDYLFLPIRHVATLLGGIVSWDSNRINIVLQESPGPHDFARFDRFVSNGQSLYKQGVYSADDVFFLGDYALYMDAQERQGNLGWVHANPFDFVRYSYLKLVSEKGSELSSDSDYSRFAQMVFVGLGVTFTSAELRQIGRDAEQNAEIVSKKIGLVEQEGDLILRDRSGNEVARFTIPSTEGFNDYKREKISRPGPDRIYVYPTDAGEIKHIIFIESKGRLRKIVPSDWEGNAPLDNQLERLSRSRTSDIAEIAQLIEKARTRAYEMVENGQMSPEEFESIFANLNIGMTRSSATSPAMKNMDIPTVITKSDGEIIQTIGRLPGDIPWPTPNEDK